MSRNGEPTDGMLREELGEFGFSDKEIDVYLTLLSQGEATTGTISDDANVTQQAVYTITDRLEDRGLVRVVVAKLVERSCHVNRRRCLPSTTFLITHCNLSCHTALV